MPRWKEAVEASAAAASTRSRLGRRQPFGVRHGQRLFLGFGDRRARPAAESGARAELVVEGGAEVGRDHGAEDAIASSPATRETPLLTPEAMPTWRSSTESSTVAVSGATVAESPTPKTSRPAGRRST